MEEGKVVNNPSEKMESDTQSGLDEKIIAALCWGSLVLVPVVVPAIFVAIEKDNEFARYHAIQSLAFSIYSIVVSIALSFFVVITFGCGFLLAFPFFVYIFIVWILGIIRAIEGKKFGDPIIKSWVEDRFIK